MQKIIWFGISTAIIGGMVFFADLREVIAALSKARPFYMAAAFFFGLSVFGIWSYTWHSFFEQMGMEIGMWKSFKMFMAGNFFNSVTPLGQFGGEPFMAYLISKNTDYSAEEGFSAVLSADIINAVPTLTFVIGGAAFQLIFGESLRQVVIQVIYITLLTTVVGGVFVYLLWFKSGRIERALISLLEKIAEILGRGGSWVGKLEERLLTVQKSFAEIGESPWHLLKTAVVAHIGFLAQVLCLAAILVSLDHSFTFTPLYFTITIASLANFSPTPGGSGTFEAAMAGLLTLFLGMNFAPALVAAILFRATTFWPGLVIGYAAFNTMDNGVEER